MPTPQNNVTLIWAHSLQRYWAFLQRGIAGIDFGVEQDLTGLSQGDVETALQGLGLSSQVISEFNRLLRGIPIGSYIVTSVPKGLGWEDRKWSIGKVTAGYRFRPDISHDRHTIQVQWRSERYTDDEIARFIGAAPAGRRRAVNPLNAVFSPGCVTE